MAKILERTALLMLTAILYFGVRCCTGLGFNFSTFNTNTASITVTNGAVLSPGAVNLTTKGINWAVGRAFYSHPIPLWQPTASGPPSLSSFSTSFSFRILNTTPTYYFGDGIAFFITADLAPAPPNSAGGVFGLLDPARNGQASNRIVAVEFDAYLNEKYGDADANHVGVDVNSIFSAVVQSLSVDFKYGVEVKAWVDYNGGTQLLSVDIALIPFTRPSGPPILTYKINLTDYLPKYSYVGLSSGTGTHNAVHQILSWQFNSSTPPAAAPAAAPSVAAAVAPPFDVVAPPVAVVPPVDTSSAASFAGAVKAGIAVGATFLFLLLAAIVCLVRSQRQNRLRMRMREWKLGDADLAQCAGPQRFTAKQIMTATKNFSDENFLGRGGFGPVYKGILPRVGTPVAVKLVGQNSNQGVKEFLAEVTIISRIRHKNLVQLQGWCHEKGQLFLVYDYMSNGSLDQHLFKSKEVVDIANPLDWDRRYNILCGLAAGLVYLHEEWEKQVIHRDVKPANVMLDEDFNARLGDFGMARLVDHNMMPQTTAAAGTLGYLAPEVTETGKATSASDVYSFGAVALEVVCGRASLDYNASPTQVRLVEFVWDMYSKGALAEVVDPSLGGEYEKGEIERVLCLGLACSDRLPSARPTMRQVLDCLLNATPTPSIRTSKPTNVSSQPFFQPPLSIIRVHSDTSTSTSTTTSTMASYSSTIPSSISLVPK